MRKENKEETQKSNWYNDLVFKAELVDHYPVRGCYVLRERSFALWEQIQKHIDQKIKSQGFKNVYFPILLPKSFLAKEEKHIQGFDAETLNVTDVGNEVLQEPLALRPTSETIFWHSFQKWIHSWRNLPLKLNQWVNIIRWEKHARPFLRTSEFLWQEGHGAYQTKEEAETAALNMIEIYRDFAQEYLALPAIVGEKSESEKFAGAENTYTIEVAAKDGRAIQAGTSHYLGQNFARAFKVQFQDAEGVLCHPFAASFGVSSRLIGTLIMVHSDKKGLIWPPKIAPTQIVIMPIGHSSILDFKIKSIKERLEKKFRLEVDQNTQKRPAWRFAHWELIGIPLRLEIGERDLEKNQVILVSRENGEKKACDLDKLEELVGETLKNIQYHLLEKAKKMLEDTIIDAKIISAQDFLKNPSQNWIRGGFCLGSSCETFLKSIGFTLRVMPFCSKKNNKNCWICQKPAQREALWAKAY